jgi:hypothetical protein
MCRLDRTARSGVGHRERMKRDSGIKALDERSRGIEIIMSDAFAKIKPTEPFRYLLKSGSVFHELSAKGFMRRVCFMTYRQKGS